MSIFHPGQRWISESEPELGLGTVLQAGDGRVQIAFTAAGETRVYAVENAPVKRVRFREGDEIQGCDGERFTIQSMQESDGLLTYVGAKETLPESRLSDRISFNRPEDRLLAGQIDELQTCRLRRRTLEHLHLARKSPVRGFVGGRIDLIPHQLYIAGEVAARHVPRVLLSDEVGLGKTIEACLILHRLLLSGRASRVLVLVPESLVHQWFVENLRKFNLWLNIFDEERCEAIQAGDPTANPFLDDQLILCSIDFLARSPERAAQAMAADWDVLVVDEAHHLEWSPDAASPEYVLVEQLGRRAEGLLLLTATPEQLGLESHFARLRLLDPDRFDDFESFRQEGRDDKGVARIVEKLAAGKKPSKKDGEYLERHFPTEAGDINAALDKIATGDAVARAGLIDDLLDLHGPGRVLFRNTRAAMEDFPQRIVHLAPIKSRADHADAVDAVSVEFAQDAGDETLVARLDLEQDARVIWLADLLRTHSEEKFLLICRTRGKVAAIESALATHLNVKTAIFHEDLSLVQRDRNAAWFAEAEGARLLICSEIGSEGRNFQFAHHLILFDLPLNPELLEQRIGRLDRIGQTRNIHIHVPYLAGSPQEVLARWYHEGLNAFESNLIGGNELLRTFGRQVHDIALEYPARVAEGTTNEFADLIKATSQSRAKLVKRLEEGRDRLLEMNSFRPAVADRLVEQIRAEDTSDALEEFMLDVFEHFGVHAEELGPHNYQLNGDGIITDAFPALPEQGGIATFDRARALGREDVLFLNRDHPMVTGAMDLLLSGEKGNAGFGCWPDPDDRTILLETLFILEAVAESRLHVDRFLPPIPVRVLLNHKGEPVSESISAEELDQRLQKAHPYKLIDSPKVSREILPQLLEKANRVAEQSAGELIQLARDQATRLLGHELERLRKLARTNDHVRQEELERATAEQEQVLEAIGTARLRLDAVRLVWKGDPAALA